MLNYYKKFKVQILNLSLKKIYTHFFLKDLKPTGYYSYIKNVVFEFLKSKYPDYEKQVFDKKLDEVINQINDYKDITATLNILFNPNFHQDLKFHYKYIENKIFFRFISYSLNKKLIKNKYSDVYDFVISQLREPLNILEIGGGLPHGFIYNIWKRGNTFFDKFTYIDAQLIHSEFVKWYCKKYNFNHEIKLFEASKTPKLDAINFNFVFAKDIFEHLDEPELLIDYLISNTKNNKTYLCLDLEHKGPKGGQHINPNLPIFKEKLIKNNFKVIKKFSEIHVWKKQ